MNHDTFAQRVGDDWIAERLNEWGISSLTEIQQKAIDSKILECRSMIVSSPTSSGKTLIAEIAALNAVRSGDRVLYLVSHKALADQKYLDFEMRFGQKAKTPLTNVSLSTGDRSEGDVDAQIRIATYEKAIGLIMAGQIHPESSLIVADELQILCDQTRGADIEALCAIFRQRGVKQFIALTATVENPAELAVWMKCELVESSTRGTPLIQQIWTGKRALTNTFGEVSLQESVCPVPSGEVSSVVSYLLEKNLGPVLVFTETKREASDYAANFVRTRQKTTEGLEISDQLELFSEPTEFSEKLRSSAERCVAFHTADLSAQERQVLEDGFSKRKFHVCFATSTLAAGVNYPFRSIIFPKLSFQYRQPPGLKIGLADYRNMSGRAGRLGLHENGYAILLPRNSSELVHAEHLLSPKNERLESVMFKLSIRKTLLSLVASNIANSALAIDQFFENTFYWHQVVTKHENSKTVLQKRTREALAWLVNSALVEDDEGECRATQLGRAAALSGLLPETAVQLSVMLDANRAALETDFEALAAGLIYACCACPEFQANPPTRFLPYVANDAFGGLDFWKGRTVPVRFDRAAQQIHQSAQAVVLYTTGLAERKIAFSTGVPSGTIQRLSFDVSWILEGMQRIASVPDMGISQSVTNRISQLSRRVRWGVPAENLDLLRLAEKHKVPGVGRQRTMELVKKGLTSFQDLIGAGKDTLLSILKHSLRVEAFLEGANSATGQDPIALQSSHIRISNTLGVGEIVQRCYKDLGTDFEKAILELLTHVDSIESKMVDTGTRQNYPDMHLKSGDLEVFLECKTTSKSHGLIGKEDAWAVIQKTADFAANARRVTLGKPRFDETCKQKAAASRDLTLVENESFIEGVLRLLLKEIDSKAFMQWLMEPGLAELERLPGRASYQLR
jgi:helicase